MTGSNYLNSLPVDMPEADRQWQTAFYKSMPEHLQKLVDETALITEASQETIRLSIGLIDHTSLKEGDEPMVGIESREAIENLCREAEGQDGLHTRAVCVYPNQIKTVWDTLRNINVLTAAVNNFPHGILSAAEAARSAGKAIDDGADEIDTVMDIKAWRDGDLETVEDKLKAVSEVCVENLAAFKVILQASAHPDYDSLYDAADTACAIGADFVKLSTGKKPQEGFGTGAPDAANPLTVAVVMQAVADYNRKNRTRVAVKVSGGLKNGLDCEKMRYLSDRIRGPEYFNPDDTSFGASSLRGSLIQELAAAGPAIQISIPSPGGAAY